LFNVSDINIDLLKYKDSSTAKWYRSMKNNTNYVSCQNDRQQYTELGLYKALMKSNKPIAE
tara:strand:- start:229 stop:411 length:183 start_codon:yes stop_codon:yes gene_type:complete